MKPTTEHVLKWAREAGIELDVAALLTPYLEAVAALAYAAGAAAEREECAALLEETRWYSENNNAKYLAEQIRARGEKND